MGAVALMHGFRGNRLGQLDKARFLSRAGYAVLLFDFQAHGESIGAHVTIGHLERHDAQAAVGFLRANCPGEKIGVIGSSMGGAAFLLAEPPLPVDEVVLEAVYPTLEQAVSNRLTMRLGGWASVLTPVLTKQLKPRLGFSADDLRPLDRVGQVTAPKLFIVGEKDVHTTLEESQQLFAAAREPKELWIIKDAPHGNFYTFAPQEYASRVLTFFGKYLREQ
jgi:fermentation-respiration switch protein FrsA (DUF1100 family)